LKLGRERLEPVHAPRRQRDVRASVRQLAGERGADPGRGTGQEGDVPAELTLGASHAAISLARDDGPVSRFPARPGIIPRGRSRIARTAPSTGPRPAGTAENGAHRPRRSLVPGLHTSPPVQLDRKGSGP
jgi:hypothetical protein